MYSLRAQQVVNRGSLHHFFHLLRQVKEPGVFRFLTDMVQHLVEHIANLLNLLLGVLDVVNLAYSLVHLVGLHCELLVIRHLLDKLGHILIEGVHIVARLLVKLASLHIWELGEGIILNLLRIRLLALRLLVLGLLLAVMLLPYRLSVWLLPRLLSL